ncbi:MAG: hypothetical protein L3J22_09745 [Xanthomonadales bacterium]|nr:hypothetical protein [Xanthomonadales bacterium]
MNKFIWGAVASIFLLLSAEAVYADGPMEEVHVTGQRIYPPGMSSDFPLAGGGLSFNPGNGGSVDELDEEDEDNRCTVAHFYVGPLTAQGALERNAALDSIRDLFADGSGVTAAALVGSILGGVLIPGLIGVVTRSMVDSMLDGPPFACGNLIHYDIGSCKAGGELLLNGVQMNILTGTC